MASFETAPEGAPEWVDITEDVASAAGGFAIDELLSAPTFSLFESMSACELMDPKMDALGNEAPQPSVVERLRRGSIPLRLTVGAAVRVLDRLLALEVAWFGGASLHESVQTCFFARDEPFAAALEVCGAGPEGDGAVAGTLAVVAAVACSLWVVEASRVAIVRADIYEEEDFCAASAASGSGVGSEDRALALARRAEAVLEEAPGAWSAALLAHVRHRRRFVEALSELLRGGASDAVAVEALVASLEEAESGDGDGALDDGDADAGDRAFGPCRDDESASAARGAAIKEGGFLTLGERQESRAGKRKVALGLLRVLDVRRAIEGWRFSSDDGARGADISHLQPRRAEHGHARLARLVALVGSEARGGGRACLPRSLAALELGGDGAPLRRLLHDDDLGVEASGVLLGRGARRCAVYGLVADSLVSSGAPTCVLGTRPGAEFAARAARATLDAVRAACSNRARLRQRLPALLLDWAALVQDAIEADALCAAALGLGEATTRRGAPGDVQYLYNWALGHSLSLMEQCLALDVSLELIAAPRELEQVFWYWEYLLAAKMTISANASRHRVVMRDTLARQPNAPPLTPADAALEQLCDDRDEAQDRLIRAKRCLCRGLHRLCATTRDDNTKEAPFADDAKPGNAGESVYVAAHLRFAKRFAMFACFADPPHVSFADYERIAQRQRDHDAANGLRESASDLFASAKQLIEHTSKIGKDPDAVLVAADADAPDLRALAKVAVANRINIARDSKATAHKKSADAAAPPTLEIDFTYHEHFPVLSLAPRA